MSIMIRSTRLTKLFLRPFHSGSIKKRWSSTQTPFSNSEIPRTEGNGGDYVSPYSDFFAMMESGRTSLRDHNLDKAVDNFPSIPTLRCGISEDVLRFRSVSHGRLMLPPYVQRDEYKVTLMISEKHIPLISKLEWETFHQIVGTRFVSGRKELRLSSNQFTSRIENKRHLCEMLDRIILGAKRLANDTQDDNLL